MMNRTLKTILIAIGALVVIGMILKVLGFVGGLVMLPVKLVMGLIGLIVGLVAGAFGSIAGLFGLVVGLGVALIPVLLLLGLVVGAGWLLCQAFKGDKEEDEDEETEYTTRRGRTRGDVHSDFRAMDERLENLETLLTKEP